MREAWLPLPAVSELIDAIVPEDYVAGDRTMTVDSVALDLPVELDAMHDAGVVSELGISPPTQLIETTVMPVFHRLRLTVARAESE
jgi:hypothetical protein